MQNIVGKNYPPFTVPVDRQWIAAFADAIADPNPIYRDEAAARAQGFAGIPAPPTFGFAVVMKANQSFMVLEELGVPKTRAMHAEQGFEYAAPILAGDVITGRQRVAEQYDKKGGALTFLVSEFDLRNQRDETVVTLRTTVVVRNVQEKA